MDARSEILARIAAARVPVAVAPRPPIQTSGRGREAIVAQFADFAAEYKANVVRCGAEGVSEAVGSLLLGTVVVPMDLPTEWLHKDIVTLPDDALSLAALDAADAVLTLCAVAIAETGTVVLDHGRGQGRRAITLVPDHHIVLVPEARIVDSVPEGVAALAEAVRAGRPLTWISGPSATSDIELSRVEGVHGPRRLDLVIVAE